MKKWMAIICCAAMLTGCSARETLETISDGSDFPVLAEPKQILVALPDEAAAPAVDGDGGLLYLCRDYEIVIQTLPGGDIQDTIETLSGFHPENLTVLETGTDSLKRYDFVWASAGETGDQLGRAVVLDDGSYHYTMTVLRNAAATETSQVVWRTVFESFTLEGV